MKIQYVRSFATAIGLFALGMTGVAQAAQVVAEYDVDPVALKGAPAGTVITFQVHDNDTCSSLKGLAIIDIADPSVQIEKVLRGKISGGSKPPKVVRLKKAVTLTTVPTELYVRVTGTGITPVGEECQLLGASGVGALECVNTPGASVLIAAGDWDNAASSACPSGYTESATYCETTSAEMSLVYASQGTCTARNDSLGAKTLSAIRHCCRVAP